MPIDVSPDLLQTFYLASFGRPADPEGLVYWSKQLKSEVKILPIIEEFSSAEEFMLQIQELGEEDFVRRALSNLIGPLSVDNVAVGHREQPLEAVLKLVANCTENEKEQLELILKQAHRATWALAVANTKYDYSVIDTFLEAFASPRFLSSGILGVELLISPLPTKGVVEKSLERREFMRQLISSLPAQIPLPDTSVDRRLEEAIIHIGTEKTGSSSLQAFFTHNKKILRRQGIASIRNKGRDDNRDIAFYGVDSFVEDDYAYQLGLLSEEQRAQWKDKYEVDLCKSLEALPDNINTVIFSSEHLQSRLKSPGNVALLKYLLEPYFKKVTVVVYLRRQDILAVSLYSTKCRNGWIESGMFPSNTTSQTPYYNYEKLLDRWAKAFGEGNVKPRVFEPEKLKDQELISDFFACTNLSVDLNKAYHPDKKNESIPESAQVAVELLNSKYQIFREQHAESKISKTRLKIIDKVSKLFPGKPKLPLRDKAMGFATMFAEPNEAVSQRWFEGKELFSTDFSNYPETIPEPAYDIEEIGRLVAKEADKIVPN